MSDHRDTFNNNRGKYAKYFADISIKITKYNETKGYQDLRDQSLTQNRVSLAVQNPKIDILFLYNVLTAVRPTERKVI